MNPELTHLMARARYAEMRRVADLGPRRPAANGGPGCESQVTLRCAGPADEPALLRLAELDSATAAETSDHRRASPSESCSRRSRSGTVERSPTHSSRLPRWLSLLIARARQIEADGRPAKSLGPGPPAGVARGFVDARARVSRARSRRSWFRCRRRARSGPSRDPSRWRRSRPTRSPGRPGWPC